MSDKVKFWFVPSCPWAWVTSRWILEAAKMKDIEIQWEIFSLGALNEDKDLKPEYRERVNKTWGPVRVLISAKNKYGPEVLLPLYNALGELFHPGAKPVAKETVALALANAKLDESLINEYENTDLDDQLRESTKAGLALVGDEVGTPIIAINDIAFFGPVITSAPKGEEALKLWNGIFAVASFPDFYELKRTRKARPQF